MTKSAAPPRESAEFQSADLRCMFPDAVTGSDATGSGANVVPGIGANVNTDPNMPREGSILVEKETFGEKMADPGESLAQRSEELQ